MGPDDFSSDDFQAGLAAAMPGTNVEFVGDIDDAWKHALNDPLGIQSAYMFQAVDDQDFFPTKEEFDGREAKFQFALPPQSIQIQRSLRGEVMRDVTSGTSIVAGGEGIGRISIQGTHGVGSSRDFTRPSAGRDMRDKLAAFFDTWVHVNDARGRMGQSQLRLIFGMVGGSWSNPESESYYVWPESFPSNQRTAGRPHSWEWSISLQILAVHDSRVVDDKMTLLSPAAAVKKLARSEGLLSDLVGLYKKGVGVAQYLRDLVSKLAKARNQIQGYVSGAKTDIYAVTDLVRGSAQISADILRALDPASFKDDLSNAVRGALYEVRKTLGQVSITAQQFHRSGTVQASLSAPQTASLSRPTSVPVHPGDSLSGIAARLLGDSTRWPELVASNDLEYPFFDFSGPSGRPGAAYDGMRVLGATDTLKIPLPASVAPVGLAADPVGTDFADAGDTTGLIGGKDNLSAALIRRIRTPRGRIPWHPQYGSGIPPLVGSALTLESAALLRQEATLCLKSDPRVLGLASVRLAANQNAVVISSEAVSSLGPVQVAGQVS